MKQLKLIPDPDQPPEKPPDKPEPFPEFGTWLTQKGYKRKQMSHQRRMNEYKRYERLLFERVEKGLPVKDLALTNLATWCWYPMPDKVREAMIQAVARQAEF